ncbi:hypothetical protein BDR26DRAFT_10282 [Obelidium mucronatum]|nr:hypothetical protein BDR26DRAFT_10282 [Obelidium mucronatum]
MLDFLPRELWHHIMLFCPVPVIIRLRRVCQQFKDLSDPQKNSLLWKRKAQELCLGSHYPLSLAAVRMIKGESHYDVVRKYLSWNKKQPLSTSTRQINHRVIEALPTINPEQRRFLVAEPISHRVLIRWTLSGPLAFYFRDPVLKAVNLTSGGLVVLDRRLERVRFSYAVPHANWVVFKDSYGEYQLGYFDSTKNTLEFVESSVFCDTVADILTSSGNGQIIPIRGYGDVVVIGVKAQPTGNADDARIKLSAVRITLGDVGGEFVAEAKIIWTQLVPFVQSLFVDNHDAFMIFRSNDSLFDFKVVSIVTGEVVAGYVDGRPAEHYKFLSKNSTYLTCSRFHLLATCDHELIASDFNAAGRVGSLAFTQPHAFRSSPMRSVISDDGSLVVRINTNTVMINRSLSYTFSMEVTDISSGVVERHNLASEDVLASGAYVLYEDLEDGVWTRNTAFVALK